MRAVRTQRHSRMPDGGPRRRSGAIVIELLICLPVWLLGLMAIVEFAELVTRLQAVAMASRIGAGTASQIAAAAMPSEDSSPVPPQVVEAIARQLESSGITWCTIVLQHNVGGGTVTLVSENPAGTCVAPDPVLPPDPNPLPPSPAVRVAVYAGADELAPNLLKSSLFGGMDLARWHVREMTTMRCEQ